MEPTCSPAPESTPIVLRGSCSCGGVTLTSSTLPLAVTICHCVTCRKLSGNPFLSFGLYHNDALTWAGEIHCTASKLATRGFCRTCNTPLFMKYHCRPDGTSVTMGLIDDFIGEMPVIKEHIFLADRVPWVQIPDKDGTNKHLGFNEPFSRRLQDWVDRGQPKRPDHRVSVDINEGRYIFGGRAQYKL